MKVSRQVNGEMKDFKNDADITGYLYGEKS